MKNGCVYMLTNKSNTVLYTGVTSDLAKRISEHKQAKTDSFTKKYKCDKLVYYAFFDEIFDAIEREKFIKYRSRKQKNKLIEHLNPKWKDLSCEL